ATDFGIMKTNDNGFISSFIEKPNRELLPQWISEVSDEMKKEQRVYLASMGIYIFNRKLLFDLLQKEKADATDFGREIIPQSIDARRVAAYQYEGYWTDIGNITSFFEANLALTDEVPRFNLFDNRRFIYTHARMLPPSKISGSTMKETMIAEGCIIHASTIERAVIGNRSRIGKDSTIVNSYIMGNDYFETIEEITKAMNDGKPLMGIGNRCYIRNAIIDKNCRIGNEVRINGGIHLADADDKLLTVKEGIVVVKKDAVIPNGFSI
ncbi:MAG TPA: sugar phosphate nucleotidyltransferase, partial [Chitinophagales bacterium]|nr:sugar phosphate nucleotidyltransferase [Chitinophagales bacterium]